MVQVRELFQMGVKPHTDTMTILYTNQKNSGKEKRKKKGQRQEVEYRDCVKATRSVPGISNETCDVIPDIMWCETLMTMWKTSESYPDYLLEK